MTGLAEIFADVEARNRDIVEAETWGHLAPEQQRTYPGTVVFAVSEYGDNVPVFVRFDDLPDSPWLFEGLNRWIGDQVLPPGSHQRALEPGVYRFTGTYAMSHVPDVLGDDGLIVEQGRDVHTFTGTTVVVPVLGEPT